MKKIVINKARTSRVKVKIKYIYKKRKAQEFKVTTCHMNLMREFCSEGFIFNSCDDQRKLLSLSISGCVTRYDVSI